MIPLAQFYVSPLHMSRVGRFSSRAIYLLSLAYCSLRSYWPSSDPPQFDDILSDTIYSHIPHSGGNSPMSNITDNTLQGFLDALASGESTPGGGGAAAHAATSNIRRASRMPGGLLEPSTRTFGGAAVCFGSWGWWVWLVGAIYIYYPRLTQHPKRPRIWDFLIGRGILVCGAVGLRNFFRPLRGQCLCQYPLWKHTKKGGCFLENCRNPLKVLCYCSSRVSRLGCKKNSPLWFGRQ